MLRVLAATTSAADLRLLISAAVLLAAAAFAARRARAAAAGTAAPGRPWWLLPAAVASVGLLAAGAMLAQGVGAVTAGAALAVAVLAAVAIAGHGRHRRDRRLADLALEGLVLAKNGCVVDVNPRVVKLTRRAPHELLGKRIVGDLLAGDAGAEVPATGTMRASLRTAAGLLIPVEVIARPLAEDPRADTVYAIRDLGDRRKTEETLRQRHDAMQRELEELRARSQRLAVVLDHFPHGVCMVDGSRHIAACNQRYADMYGMPPGLAGPGATVETIVQHRLASGILAAEDADAYSRWVSALSPEGCVKTYALTDGRILRITRQATPEGGWIDVHEDITERERLDAQLASQNARLARHEAELKAQNLNLDIALSNMAQGLAMYDAEERLVLANARYAELYGIEARRLQPGMTLRAVIEVRKAAGLYTGQTVEQVLATTRSLVARGVATDVASRPRPGLIVSVSIQPRPDGGWVVTVDDITEREEMNARLVAQNALLQARETELNAQNLKLDAAMANISQGVVMYDADHRVMLSNTRYAEMYGLTAEQVRPGTTLREIFALRFAKGQYVAADRDAILGEWERDFGDWESHIEKLADQRTIAVSRRRLPNRGWVVTHEDITERAELHARLQQQNTLLKEQEEKLRTQNIRLDAALNNMAHGLAMYDAQQRLVICNKQYTQMYDLAPEQVRPGTPLQQIIEHRIARGEFRGKTADELLQGMSERTRDKLVAHYVSHLADGRHISVAVQRMPDGGIVTTHNDITEQRRTEAKIAHMALHDTLTGLPNRVLLNERLEHALKRGKRGEIVAIHLLDLDNFKSVNDSLGHPAGDSLLKTVAERLRTLLRETDTIARMGGDEFAIIQSAISQPADATALAHRVIEEVSAPFEIEGHQVVIGTSVGIAVGPSDGTTPEQLIRNADLALYRAKGDGRGTYRFFEREMDAQMQARRAIEDDLRGALPSGEFELYYQPIVNLSSDRISGFEALIRWRHPEKGMVAPDLFIPLAEEIGFIVPLGEWAIREACAQAARWPGDLKVAVNLSPAQFRSSGLVQIVVSALATSGLPAERLELEITETILLQDSEATLSTLYQLRALGVHIAMDDFGTGYSSLSYLQSFPFDKIKIDRSFVKDITDGVGSLNIVRAVAAMANGLGMVTTAEGVETREQLQTVRAEGCTEMQGFVFSRPMPASEVERFIESRQGRATDDDAAQVASAGAA